jgi:quercetin dioxygenase-like cupin family protein
MSTSVQENAAKQFVYRFEELVEAPQGVCSARIKTRGALAGSDSAARGRASEVTAIMGERVHVALVRTPRGAASELFTNPGEQFHYVLEGSLTVDIDGGLVPVPQGHAVHVPAGLPHRLLAGDDAELVTYSVQDARHDFAVAPLAGTQTGGERQAQTSNVTGRSVRYAYDIGGLDAVPPGLLSAKVTPRDYISRKSTSFGAALSGERVHVAVIGKVRATGTKLHTHPNEQFSYVLRGNVRYEIAGQSAEAPRGSVTHIPPGTVHGVVAYPEEDVITFVAKDTSHGMSGPPIDGIEDGPVYWPGFDPRRV